MDFKRLVIINDTHGGSRFGLTHPDYWTFLADPSRKSMGELWWRWDGAIEEVKAEHPIDIAAFVGDLVDGPGPKSLGTEQTTSHMGFQVDAATRIVEAVGAPENHFIMGTAYHTGHGEDYEERIARATGGTFDHRCFLTVNGVRFDLRHHTGRSSIPYGMNAVEKEKMWNSVLNSYGKEKRADVVLRGHIHWFRYAGTAQYLVMSLPALQYPMTKYGARCTGDYDMGFVYFDIYEDGSYKWKPVIFQLAAAEVPEYIA